VEDMGIWRETAQIHSDRSLASCVLNLVTLVEIVQTLYAIDAEELDIKPGTATVGWKDGTRVRRICVENVGEQIAQLLTNPTY
jgi:hypothetical protein